MKAEKEREAAEKQAALERQEKEAAILRAKELQAQLDALILFKDHAKSTAENLKHLKLLALQPAGKTTAQTHSFPSTAEHFNLLRALGKDR